MTNPFHAGQKVDKESVAPRPRGTLQHHTSREYAERAKSRSLDPEHNEVLTYAADGQEVDVVLFRKAATAALSLASTRAGHSAARRTYAKEARHLIHWADAVIDNHIDGLPAYEPGERSRKVVELEARVGDYEEAVREATTTLDRIVETSNRRDALLAETVAERDTMAEVIAYALDRLDAETRARVHGFWDGLQQA